MKKIEQYSLFFDECVKDNCIIKKYLPVKEYLFKIIKYYNFSDSPVFTTGYFKDGINTNKVGFTLKLLEGFNYLMKMKKIDELDPYIDFLLNNDTYCFFFMPYLQTLVLKDKLQSRSDLYNDYYWQMEQMCWVNAKTYQYGDKNLRITQVMESFQRLNLFNENDDTERNWIYHNIAPYVVSEFYLTDLDISLLDKALSYLYDNYDELYNYLLLNDPSFYTNRDTKIHVARLLLNNSLEQTKVIK